MKQEKLSGVVAYAITPYDQALQIHYDAFAKYVAFLAREGACAVVISSNMGDIAHLTMEERCKLVNVAAQAAGGEVSVISTVVPGEISPAEQAERFLASGADAINLCFPTSNPEHFQAAFESVAASGTNHIVVTDNKSGGFDMNNGAKGPRPTVGLPEDMIVGLFQQYPQFRNLIMALPLNVCGSKASNLLSATDGGLNLIAQTATDQFLEQLDRGVGGFVTGAFARLYQRIIDLYAQGGTDKARPLFFDLLPAIVWTKQYVDREPYLYQLYLQDKGIIPCVAFRTNRYIDRYMARYGAEMLDLVKQLEENLSQYE